MAVAFLSAQRSKDPSSQVATRESVCAIYIFFFWGGGMNGTMSGTTGGSLAHPVPQQNNSKFCF